MELVKLKKLIKQIPDIAVRGSKDIEITGISSNSKLVAPGNLFIAKKGLLHDGARFIPDAVESGAVAILTDMYNPFYSHIVQIIASDVSSVEALIAQEYYAHASSRLYLMGVTGTNGKTTTSYLIKHLFDRLDVPCGLIGTIEWIVGQHYFPSSQTTPDVITNNKLFYEMRMQECQACVMEVSSHALEQGRVHSVEFDAAVFTNLTQDHLDYHKTMQAYADAKSLLFSSLKNHEKTFPKLAIVNGDCPYSQRMIQDCPSQILTYGIDNSCDLQAADIRLSPNGMRMNIHYRGMSYPFVGELIGRFNVYNLLAAIGAGIARSFPIDRILDTLSSFHTVQGRLERVENAKELNIFVDYAHTDDALVNVLKTLREITEGQIIIVFGCGGNRDALKRPKMGCAAEAFSDVVIVTSDNPRSEDPMEIITQILSGFKQPSKVQVIVDRKEAIRTAVNLCKPEDVLLIAGKGHETYQIFSHGTVAFDDRKVALEACNNYASSSEMRS